VVISSSNQFTVLTASEQSGAAARLNNQSMETAPSLSEIRFEKPEVKTACLGLTG
jgi:hypothetical protein